jgi:hypothetical protein
MSLDGLKKISKMPKDKLKEMLKKAGNENPTDEDVKLLQDSTKYVLNNKELKEKLGGDDGVWTNQGKHKNKELWAMISDPSATNDLGVSSSKGKDDDDEDEDEEE